MSDRKTRITVAIESPYAGDIEKNVRYARACLFDCLTRGEAPFASHLLYTQPGVLDDAIPRERTHGIEAGIDLALALDKRIVYTDLGISSGMVWGIEAAETAKQPIEYRQLGTPWNE